MPLTEGEIAYTSGGKYIRVENQANAILPLLEEIDEMEKNVIYENFGELVQNVTEDSFNIDFGTATKKFIELEKEDSRQKQY